MISALFFLPPQIQYDDACNQAAGLRRYYKKEASADLRLLLH